MDGAPRSLPERDDSGFVALSALRAAARGLTAAEFVAAFPHPALLGLARDPASRRGQGPPANVDRREISYQRTNISSASDTPRPSSAEAFFGYAERVALLLKRPGNPFPQIISVGRAMSNDVVFLLDTVSKLQGYFTREAASWRFTDQHSSNGTLLNHVRLEAGKSQPIADGDRIRFGLEVEVVFLTPETLHQKLGTKDEV